MVERRAGGRPPSLSRRAHAWLVVGGVAMALGFVTGRADGVRLGVGLWIVLFGLYLDSLRVAIAVWRRQLGVRWETPRTPAYLGEPIRSTIVVGNRSPIELQRLRLRPVVGSAFSAVRELTGDAPAQSEVRFAASLLPRTFGSAHVHGVFLTVADRFGLFVVDAYFPLPDRLRILLPRLTDGTRPPVRLAERATEHARPEKRRARRGEEVPEIQKLRDWQPGDPFRRIAWHKTARTGRLLVRELDRAPAGDLCVLIDLGPSMRAGVPGERPIDRALLRGLRLVRRALADGYRVGVVLFDLVPLGTIAIGRGHQVRAAAELLVERWGELGGLVERGLAEGELGGLIGRYLQVQHGLDLRTTPPPLDDPRWARLLVSGTGELYDLDELDAALRGTLGFVAPTGLTVQQRLLRFALERGIELGWRMPGQPAQAVRWTQTLVKLLDDLPAHTAALLLTDFEDLHLPSVRGLPARLSRRGIRLHVEPILPVDGPASAPGRALPVRLHRRELLRRASLLSRRARAAGLRVAGGRATSHVDAPRVVQ